MSPHFQCRAGQAIDERLVSQPGLHSETQLVFNHPSVRSLLHSHCLAHCLALFYNRLRSVVVKVCLTIYQSVSVGCVD